MKKNQYIRLKAGMKSTIHSFKQLRKEITILKLYHAYIFPQIKTLFRNYFMMKVNLQLNKKFRKLLSKSNFSKQSKI